MSNPRSRKSSSGAGPALVAYLTTFQTAPQSITTRAVGYATALVALLVLTSPVNAQPKTQDFISRLLSGAFWNTSSNRTVPEIRKPRQLLATRTYCVRLCDGYYWPISTRKGSNHAAATCQASCNTPARLFRIPASGQSTADMLDLNRNRYAELPTAFKYRKSFDPTCSCRPAPWSTAEEQRHIKYATLQRQGKLIDHNAQKPAPDTAKTTKRSLTRTRPKTNSPKQGPSLFDQVRAASKQKTPAWHNKLFGTD